jgi:hypothetical protein
MNVSTFYRNQRPALSFFFRNVIALVGSTYNHLLLGKGSSNIVDENRVVFESETNIGLLGKIDVSNNSFHSIMELTSTGNDNTVRIDYKNSVQNKGKLSMTPVIEVTGLTESHVSIRNLALDNTASVVMAPSIKTPMSSAMASQNITTEIPDPEEKRAMLADGVEEVDAIKILASRFSEDITERIGIACQEGTERYYDIKNKFLG